MSSESTTKLIRLYEQRIGRPRWFSGFFKSPPNNFHTTEKVEIDIIRAGQQVAVPVQNLRSGARKIDLSQFVNKAYTPAVYKYESTVAAVDLMDRAAGVDPFTDPVFNANATNRAFRSVRKMEDMIRDGVELMASQVMQTGTITLVDENGDTIESYDFQPKDATGTLGSGDLIVTTGTTWATDGSTGNPISDLETLADNQRATGYDPKRLIFGDSAWIRFLANTTVVQRYNLINASFGRIAPETRGSGATWQGTFSIGSYTFELWTYNATYAHPQTGTITRYMDTDKVVMMADGELDLTWGAIPTIEAARDQRALAFLPPRMSFGAAGLDLTLGAYFTQDAQNLVVSVGARPLTIPTAIDSIAVIDVTT